MDATQRYITKIARAAGKYAAGALRKNGIGITEYECIRIIRKNEGLNQEQLSEALNIDKAAVTRILNNLEKKGYARRQKDETDRRSNKIYSTSQALDVKFDETNAEGLFYEWLLKDVAPADSKTFLRVLDQLYIISKQERRANFININDWLASRKKWW